MLELKENAYFISITKEAQKRAVNGEWRLYDKWSTLASKAGFDEIFFREKYKYLCSYSHSSRLSIIQIQQTKTLLGQTQIALAFKGILILVLAKFIYDYIELLPQLKSVKYDDPRYSLVLQWKEAAEIIGKQILPE